MFEKVIKLLSTEFAFFPKIKIKNFILLQVYVTDVSSLSNLSEL